MLVMTQQEEGVPVMADQEEAVLVMAVQEQEAVHGLEEEIEPLLE